MRRLYHYVGPRELLDSVASQPLGSPVTHNTDLRTWVAAQATRQSTLVATFVVDAVGRLLLAERHSEHVVCVGGKPVAAAGELVLKRASSLIISSVTNQSTGYCPEPDCWSAVQAALEPVDVDHPADFTPSFVFRRCESCGQTNIVKDDEWVCSVCMAELPRAWNFG